MDALDAENVNEVHFIATDDRLRGKLNICGWMHVTFKRDKKMVYAYVNTISVFGSTEKSKYKTYINIGTDMLHLCQNGIEHPHLAPQRMF